MLVTRAATLEDARYVGERLREGDALECAMFGVSGLQAIEVGMDASIIKECMLVAGEPAAVFGLHVPDFMGGVGYPWILTNGLIEQRRVGYARTARVLIGRALAIVPRLENVVDVRYTRAVSLLDWLGFTLEPEVFGIRRFWMEKN